MTMEISFIITSFVTLFVIIDPIGVAPVFITLTQGQDLKGKRSIATRACLTAMGILAAFAFLGEAVLGFIGISMPAFTIAGGILLFLMALDMLFERQSQRRDDQGKIERPDPSVFPIAIPLLAGPGSIASTILLENQVDTAWGNAAVLLVVASVILLVWVFFLISHLIEKLLGRVGINVITRVLGMLLAALSVQFVLDGVRAYGLI